MNQVLLEPGTLHIKQKNVFKYFSLKNCSWLILTDFKDSRHSEVLLLFSLHISIVLSLRYKPPFIFSGIVSDKCRESNEDSNHYYMKNKQRHSFHGNTLFITRFNFIPVEIYEDLKSMRLIAYFDIFRKCF